MTLPAGMARAPAVAGVPKVLSGPVPVGRPPMTPVEIVGAGRPKVGGPPIGPPGGIPPGVMVGGAIGPGRGGVRIVLGGRVGVGDTPPSIGPCPMLDGGSVEVLGVEPAGGAVKCVGVAVVE
jgi:hypothetical protein